MYNFATISTHPGVRPTLALQFINKNSASSEEMVKREREKNGHAEVRAFKSPVPLTPEAWREELIRRGVDMSNIPTAGGRGGRVYADGEYQMAASGSRSGPRLVSVNTQPLRARTPFEYLSEDIQQAEAVIDAAQKEIVSYQEYITKLREAIPGLEKQVQTMREKLESLTEADGKPVAKVEETAPATNEEEAPAPEEKKTAPKKRAVIDIDEIEAAWRLANPKTSKESNAKWHARFVAAAQAVPAATHDAPMSLQEGPERPVLIKDEEEEEVPPQQQTA